MCDNNKSYLDWSHLSLRINADMENLLVCILIYVVHAMLR